MTTGARKSVSKKSSTRKKTPAKASSVKKKATAASTKKKAAKKVATKKAATSGAAVKADKTTRVRKAASPSVSAEERLRMIAELAYLRAERRGFSPGGEQDDWFVAEREVDARLGSG